MELSQHVGQELALDLLIQMVNIRFQLVDGSNLISNLQAKLYSFRRSVLLWFSG